MTTVTIDATRKVISIDRADRQKLYVAKPASWRRVLKLTAQIGAFVYAPVFTPGLHRWIKVQL